ncbi:hypothetical protein DPMN_049327 [Dreissena polymorpha]|uniref:Uncharacterized protein n=1 Tax=Dreissena polymorpha TaxID=45954 RepID=A0A9D4HKD5_DREPO|nr:hypothetical protein DPMN_049327 [Dreissena polymorpha]
MDRCPLCFGTFQKSKLLLCLDTMFFTCLDVYVLKACARIKDLPYPMCDLEQMVPEGGVSKLADNQRIKVEQTLERALAATDDHVPNEMRLNSRPLSVLFKKNI